MSSHLFWNTQGIGTSSQRLKKLIMKFRLKILAIAEPKVVHSQLVLWKDKLGFVDCCSNASVGGKLWLFWD